MQAIVLPRASVLQDQGGNYVFVVDAEGRAQRRPVRLGRTINADVVVEDGLQGGETVIVDGPAAGAPRPAGEPRPGHGRRAAAGAPPGAPPAGPAAAGGRQQG